MSYKSAAIGSIGTVIMGLSPKGDLVSANPADGLPLLNGPTEFGPVHPTPRQWAVQWARVAEPGDTLFCVRGSTTGRMNTAQTKYAIGRGIAAVRGSTSVDTAFLRNALVDGLSDLLSLTSGSVFPNISAGDLKGFEVPWPDEHVRADVVAVMNAIDDRTASHRQAIATATNMLDALSQVASADLPSVPLGTIARVSKVAVNPSQFGDDFVDHYSLPAFDDGARPERLAASSIMSGKQLVSGRSILLSRLNPRTDRTWWVTPSEGYPALASTEFSVLVADDELELAALWLAVRDDDFRTELMQRVTGTSGSHQRVRPDDLLSIDVPDFRSAREDTKRQAHATLLLIEQKRAEIARLDELARVVRPELLSGRMVAPRTRGVEA